MSFIKFGSHSSSLLCKLVIPLKSELAVELLEKGRVRFWLQADKISANAKVDYIFNDNVLPQGEVREQNTTMTPVICIFNMFVVYNLFWVFFLFLEIQNEL